MIYETVHAVYFVIAIVATIVTATWSLHRRISSVELKVEKQSGDTNTELARMQGAIDVLGAKIQGSGGNGHATTSKRAKR